LRTFDALLKLTKTNNMKSILLGALILYLPHTLFSQQLTERQNIPYLLPGGKPIAPAAIVDLNVHRLSGNRVLVSWHTQSEENSKGFFIERKKQDEIAFAPIGFVGSRSMGKDSTITDYSFTDQGGAAGACTYRIRQRDASGVNYYTLGKQAK
jgi:hypothetical protein